MDLLRKIKRRIFGAKEETKAFLGSYDEWTKKYFPVMKKKVAEELSDRDSSLKVAFIKVNASDKDLLKKANDAASNSNADYISFQEDGFSETLFSSAIRTAAKEDPSAVFIYTDSDREDPKGNYFDPSLKPDESIYYLCSYDYIGRAFAVKRSAFTEAGGLDLTYSNDLDAALLDLKLRLLEKGRACHFPGVYYHSESESEKRVSFEAGKNAVSSHFKRIGIEAEIEKGEAKGTFSIRINSDAKPLISVIIPNKDHIDELQTCLKSLEKSTYENLEIIIVENNSELDETFSYYEKLSKENSSVRIIKYDGTFNYSKINDLGVSEAKGDYILFLNNDTEMIDPDSIKNMLSVATLPSVGAVGARLFYPDETVQHAGVTLGVGGIAANAFSGAKKDDPGYMNRICCMQELSAVTAACLLMKKADFDEIGGFTEELAVAFNDVDLCMKIRALGKKIIYYPNATFFHYESKSRGIEDTPEKVKRFNSEIDFFKERWGKELLSGDPYYNPYLNLNINDFWLKP